MTGTLYLCATPIGNLQDMTPRVVETLRTVDLIAAEDTRNSIKLLNHFDIHTPMTSYHEYNKVEKARQLVGQLQAGRSIALVTDAGTPAISDPGEVLVRMCQDGGVPVTSLPSDKKEKREVLEELARETRTIVLYEAPHHLTRTLEELYQCLGDRRITLCRELTKKFETVVPTTLALALEDFRQQEPRGEYVLVLEGKSRSALRQEEIAVWESMSIEEHMDFYRQRGMEDKEAMKQVARDRGVSKREVYACLHRENRE